MMAMPSSDGSEWFMYAGAHLLPLCPGGTLAERAFVDIPQCLCHVPL